MPILIELLKNKNHTEINYNLSYEIIREFSKNYGEIHSIPSLR